MTLNIIILLLLAFALWRGYQKGLFQIIASFVLFIAALLLGSALGAVIGKALISDSYLNPIIGFFIGFIVIMVAGFYVIKKIKPKKGVISGIDRILGAIFSGVRMLLVIGLVAAFFRLFHQPPSKSINESKLYSVSLDGVAAIVHQLKPLAATSNSDIFNDTK
ncbi:MAG TPA: CvpA family protein [Candidatus Kapabacteria bacterium]|nr:CvpA family protein [Candidatus Kapabacteria bacterium]